MANNLRLFNTNSEYQSADLVHPAVSYVIETDKVIYEPTPPTPVFQGKWKATYSDSHTESAQCNSSNAIVRDEISLNNLVSVEIGDCVTQIGVSAFQNTNGLSNVIIGSGVTSIKTAAFYLSSKLKTIIVKAIAPPSLGNMVFMGSYNIQEVYVPAESVEVYKTAGEWAQFADKFKPIP